MMKPGITADLPVEELVALYPEAVGFLREKGLRCILCGEPRWGTLGEIMAEDGIEDPEALIRELNDYLRQRRS